MRSSTDNARVGPSSITAFGTVTGTAGGTATGGVEHLTTTECWRLIGAETLGRLAITARDGAPDVLPLNFTVHDRLIYFRSAPGSKLAALAARPLAALEVDGDEAGLRWSVVVRGEARRLNSDQEIRDSGVKRIVSSSPTAKYNYFCLEPSSIFGRRFADKPGEAPANHQHGLVRRPIGAQEPTRPVDDTVMRAHRDSPGNRRPLRIAHFPPR